ncbi:hypothetical protein STEG23_008923 [Scotinomys teguina]
MVRWLTGEADDKQQFKKPYRDAHTVGKAFRWQTELAQYLMGDLYSLTRCLLDHPANYVACKTGQVAPRRGARGTDTDRTARKIGAPGHFRVAAPGPHRSCNSGSREARYLCPCKCYCLLAFLIAIRPATLAVYLMTKGTDSHNSNTCTLEAEVATFSVAYR